MKSLARSNSLVCLLSHERREVREEHTTEQPEPTDTYSESDGDTGSEDENEHADQIVI